jgi:hypothetical protein
LPDGFSPRRIFFFFLVRRYAVEFASPGGGKSLAGQRLVGGSEAIFSEFRLGGGTKSSTSEALFVTTSWLLVASLLRAIGLALRGY